MNSPRRALRVALMMVEGTTVRETAAQLFLSPKTIEAHLVPIYRKLGIHNRAQLIKAMSPHATPQPETSSPHRTPLGYS
jgi:DNA-binding NarL/FixJ family response regulator